MHKKTALFACHLESNAKMIDFAGWNMPLHYGSQIDEHHLVRKSSGIFDVSHMTILDCHGDRAGDFLRTLLANNIDRLSDGKALYTCMLNHEGGVIDDLIVYQINDQSYRLVTNAATHDKDIAWIAQHGQSFDIELQERHDFSMLAIQGPDIRSKIASLFDPNTASSILQLNPFSAQTFDSYFISRTGYTGEDGFEILLPNEEAPTFWKKCIHAGIHPCGLGARDTLRLEAGLNLYGIDMDETVSPLESNLAWTIAFDPVDRPFIGRHALEKQRNDGIQRRLVGLILEESGVLRNHQKVLIDGIGEGQITSGSFSPTLQKGIALARVPVNTGNDCWIEKRGKLVRAFVIHPPFVRHGKPIYKHLPLAHQVVK